MLSINKISFSILQVAKSDTVIITEVRQWKEFVNGVVTNKVIGYIYQVVCPCNCYEAFSIKVEEKAPAITPEELEAKGGTVKAKPKNFVGKFYQNKNKEILFTAKATSMEVVG